MLSDVAVRQAKPTDKTQRLFDGEGLYLEIAPSGGKWWRFKYRFLGKEKRLSLGVYPDVGLKMARERRDEARRLLANQIDPSEHRKQTKAMAINRANNSFEAVAREWISKFSPGWSASYTRTIVQLLERDLFPWIGGSPIGELTGQGLQVCLERIADRGVLDTAHRARQYSGQVFRYAIATGRAERDVCADLKGILPSPKTKHFPAITDPKALAVVLRAINEYPGSMVVKCALRLLPLVFVRPGELRNAEWSEIDLDGAVWAIPAERMKMREPHIVPLSLQAVAILRELHPLTGGGKLVFTGARRHTTPLSIMTLSTALRTLGFAGEMTAHGFRAAARTLLDEVLNFRVDLIEHQLAHTVRDPNGRAYNRTTHLPERRKMMQEWADYLDGLWGGGANGLAQKLG